MLRALIVIGVICIARTHCWHLTDQESDAKTKDPTKLEAIAAINDIETPMQAEVNSKDTMKEIPTSHDMGTQHDNHATGTTSDTKPTAIVNTHATGTNSDTTPTEVVHAHVSGTESDTKPTSIVKTTEETNQHSEQRAHDISQTATTKGINGTVEQHAQTLAHADTSANDEDVAKPYTSLNNVEEKTADYVSEDLKHTDVTHELPANTEINHETTVAPAMQSDHVHEPVTSEVTTHTPTSNEHGSPVTKVSEENHEHVVSNNNVEAHAAGENIHPADNNAAHTEDTNVVHDPVDAVTTPPRPTTDKVATTRSPKDVDPLNIFVDDITFQRFPPPMDYSIFKEKIVGREFKKLYILEETDRRLFSQVRQLKAKYKMAEDDNELYVNMDFRFIFSRQCQEIVDFKLGAHVGNTNEAYFEKDLGNDLTERILFFSESPDDYVFVMSCTDRKTSPYACRDKFYVTLDSARDPPNQFPWLLAAEELKLKMDLSFQDPRFVFNFVMTPCA